MFESWLFEKLGGKLFAKILIACEEVGVAHLDAANDEIRARAPQSSSEERERTQPPCPERKGKGWPHMRYSKWAQVAADLPEEWRRDIEAGGRAPAWYHAEVGAHGQQLARASYMSKAMMDRRRRWRR